MKKNIIRRVGALLLAGAMMTVSASAAAQPKPFDAEHPYAAPVTGMFHEQAVDGGVYSVYLPESLDQCVDGILIAVPDGTTAEAFTQSSLGEEWLRVSEAHGVALAFAEPASGGEWNLDGSGGRDEAAYLKAVSDNFHNKSENLDAAFDLNERAFYVVGYEEGGAAAQEFVMAWPALICGAVSVDGYAVPDEMMDEIGDALSYPFVQAGSMEGQQENQLPNNEIPVPVWLIASDDAAQNNENVASYWIAANNAQDAASNTYASGVYENGPARVWLTDSEDAAEVTPEIMYTEFLSGVQRFVGDPGGRLAFTVSHENNGETGFFYSEEKVNGVIRRWYTYVPSSYTGEEGVPLVLAIHGYSSSIDAFTGDSRWQDVAEEHGFIVVFPQAYMSRPVMGNINAPVWNTYSFALGEDAVDDVVFLEQLIALTEERYSIDSERIYATGHSNGSTMTWALGLDATELFAAIAPVGHNSGARRGSATRDEALAPTEHLSASTPENDPELLLPVWSFKGEYDVDGGPELTAGSTNLEAMQVWTARNGVSAAPSATSTDSTGRYQTSAYTAVDSNVPLVQYTVVENSPLAYLPEEAEMIWEEFFSKYSRAADGSLYYEGQLVEKSEQTQFIDLDGHWAQTAAENAVAQGWLNGTSETTFEPDTAATRGMVVTVLGRMAGAAGDASAAAQFTDVAPDMYYAPYIGWALQEGIVSGTSSTTFEPELDITREEFAVMVANYAQYADQALAETPTSLDRFSDAGSISSWAQEGMQYCVDTGLLSGHDDGSLAPQGDLTRAELATILNRITAA